MTKNDIQKDVLEKLTLNDDKFACSYCERIIAESRETDAWYGCFDEFASLMNHSKSLVRSRTLSIIASNVRWDDENKFDRIMPKFLLHITDEKPITARQCIKALAETGRAKPYLIPDILSALRSVDLSRYKDSMRPLIEKDISQAVERLLDIINEETI